MELRLDQAVPLIRRAGLLVRYGLAGVRRKELFEAQLEQLAAPAPAVPATYRFGDSHDLRERLTAERHDYDRYAKQLMQRRLQFGDRLVLGELHGEVIFSGWLMVGTIECGTRRVVRISPQRAYAYKLHTVAAYRGLRMVSGFYQFIQPVLIGLGCRSVVCWIAESNAASIAAHRGVGFAPVGQAYELRVGCRSWFWMNRAVSRRLAAP